MECKIALGVFMGLIGYRFVMGDWLLSDEDSAFTKFIMRAIMTFLFVCALSIIYQITLGGTV